jgi:hypothetical protein
MSARSKAAKLIDPPGHHSRAIAHFDGGQIEVDPGEVVGRAVLYGLPFEAAELRVFFSVLREDDTFLDIGANFGLYSVLAARRLSAAGRIVSFEPNPIVRELLNINVKRATPRSKMEVQPLAVGAKSGVASFVCASDSAYSG